jgi:hypothetical protein
VLRSSIILIEPRLCLSGSYFDYPSMVPSQQKNNFTAPASVK